MGTVVMVFSGEYDLTHQLSVRADFESLVDESAIIFEMSAVTYLDSTFVGELVRFRALRVDRNLRPPSIVRCSLALRKLFSILGLGGLFRIVDLLSEVLPKNGEFIDIKYARPGDGTDPPHISIYSTEDSRAPAWNGLGAPASGRGLISAHRGSKIGSLSVTINE
jgi:anti-anti-sigma regulatory factor